MKGLILKETAKINSAFKIFAPPQVKEQANNIKEKRKVETDK